MTESSAIAIRPFDRDDIPFAQKLVEAAGWNQVPRDWETFLETRPHGAFLATWDGAPAGTVTSLVRRAAGGEIGWIAMVLVDPVLRRRGIGTRLLERALDVLAEASTVGLDATGAGRHVYLPLGFADGLRIRRFTRRGNDSRRGGGTRSGVRPVERADVSSLIELDRRTFGGERAELVRGWLARAPDLALILPDESGMSASPLGFLLARDGRLHTHLGPLVAEDEETARALLERALEIAAGRSVVIDALVDRPGWEAELERAGFVRERDFVRMWRGEPPAVDRPQDAWAIAGPDFG